MTREVFIVVTALGGWSWSNGIDMLTSRIFNDKPVGFTMDGWTVASRSSTRADADHVRQQALRDGRDSIVLVFYEDLLEADRSAP